MPMDQEDRLTPPPGIRLVRRVLDGPLRRVHWIYWPFWAAVRARDALGAALCLCANEYQKGRFGSCGHGVRIYGRFRVTCPRNLHIGDNVHINENAYIRAEGGVSIGDNTHIGRNLVIYSMNHNYQGARLPYDHTLVDKPVRIGRNAWIGINVSIAPGAQIGDGAIVAMGTVIAGEVPECTVVGLAPPRVLKQRDLEHYRQLDRAGRYGAISGYPYQAGPGPAASGGDRPARPTEPPVPQNPRNPR